MKKKGFTLIELLAVIVILAIIALIATPIVMNVIENSKKGAAERSAENYLKAVETAVGTERIDGNIMSGEYTITDTGNLCPGSGTTCTDEEEIKIEMSGNKPSSGTIFIENGKVVEKLTEGTEKTSLAFPDYTVNYKNDGKLEATKNQDNNEPSQGGESNSKVVYRWSTETINLNQEIDPSAYTTDPTSLGTDYYLKHVVENNIVTATYACAKYGDDVICLRGGKDENGNSYYNENKSILKGLQDNGLSCNLDTTFSNCAVGSVQLSTGSLGNVLAFRASGGDGGGCPVDNEGSSKCESL